MLKVASGLCIPGNTKGLSWVSIYGDKAMCCKAGNRHNVPVSHLSTVSTCNYKINDLTFICMTVVKFIQIIVKCTYNHACAPAVIACFNSKRLVNEKQEKSKKDRSFRRQG